MQKLIKTLALGVVVAWSATALAEEIKVGGGAAPIENIFKKIKLPFEKQTGMQLVLTADGPAVTMGAPSTKVQKLFDFIATQGQQYIAR